jgi:flagellar hook-basal body complex protein FliE
MLDAISWFGARLAPAGVDRIATPTASPPPAVPAEGPSFGEIFDQISRETVQSLRGAEAVSISAMRGEATTLDVVEAIKSAEQALQTATAVRDKIVQAYQEVSRMAI